MMPRNCQDKPATWRQRRAKAAGLSAGVRRRSRAAEAAKGLPGPQAWRLGYRTGYQTAMRWWKLQMAKALKRAA